MSDMVIVNGVRYRIEDAIKLGLVEPINLEPTVVEPTEVPDDVEEAENEPVADTTPSQPGGSRRKAPRRVN